MRTNKNDVEDLSVELEKAYQLNLVLADYLQDISNCKATGDDQGVFYLAEQNIDRMAIIEDTIQDNTRKMIKECNSEIEDSQEVYF